MLKGLFKKIGKEWLSLTNQPAYIAEKAREEKWPEISLELKAVTEADGGLTGYSVIAGNPSQGYEIKVIPVYESFKKRIPGWVLTVTNPQDLVILTVLNSLYFLRDEMIPEAQKRSVRTRPDLQSIQSEIKGLEGKLNRKYLSGVQ